MLEHDVTTLTCFKCHKTLPNGSKYCPFCGEMIPKVDPVVTKFGDLIDSVPCDHSITLHQLHIDIQTVHVSDDLKNKELAELYAILIAEKYEIQTRISDALGLSSVYVYKINSSKWRDFGYHQLDHLTFKLADLIESHQKRFNETEKERVQRYADRIGVSFETGLRLMKLEEEEEEAKRKKEQEEIEHIKRAREAEDRNQQAPAPIDHKNPSKQLNQAKSILSAIPLSILGLFEVYLIYGLAVLIIALIFAAISYIPILSGLVDLLFRIREDTPDMFAMFIGAIIAYVCSVEITERIVKNTATRKLTLTLTGIYLIVFNVLFLIINVIANNNALPNLSLGIAGIAIFVKGKNLE
jgi:hypothetical protein